MLFTREGGSGPEADLADILQAPLVFVAVGLDSDRIHAPNEKVEMDLLLKGAQAAAYLWEELATELTAERAATVSEEAQIPAFGTALGRLALARGEVDRSAHFRNDEEWLAAAWARPDTRVVVVDHGRALVRFAGDGAAAGLHPARAGPGGATGRAFPARGGG